MVTSQSVPGQRYRVPGVIADPTGSRVLLQATGCATIEEALSWLADDHPIEQGTDLHRLLRAVVLHGLDDPEGERALRRLARLVATSDLDSGTVLFDEDAIVPAARFRAALELLASRSPGGSLGSVTASAVIAAQRADPFTMEALCAVAGVSYKELAERVGDLPGSAAGPFGPSQIRRAFAVFEAIVRGDVTTDVPGAVPTRPIELMPGKGVEGGGWGAVEAFRTAGVPYEILLSQRAAGGAWLAHRNRTSSKLAPLLADRLCREFATRGISYLRSSSIGGTTTPREIVSVSGCDRQMGLIALDSDEHAGYGVLFSTARDSGTASKNASRLRAMKRADGLPIAVVVAGPGWAARNETAALAASFGGRLYSERSLDELANDIALTLGC